MFKKSQIPDIRLPQTCQALGRRQAWNLARPSKAAEVRMGPSTTARVLKEAGGALAKSTYSSLSNQKLGLAWIRRYHIPQYLYLNWQKVKVSAAVAHSLSP